MNPGAISPDQLGTLLEQPAPHALLDVRERAAFERGHIFRATPMPRRLLETRVPVVVTAPATLIVLYDDDGTLSVLAAATLAEMGYTEVFVLTGGLAGWRRAGRPVVQGLNVPSKVFGEHVLHDRKTPEVTCLELAAHIADGRDMVIVDTRTPEEYHRGCLPGAWSMPGGELVLRIGEVVERPDQTIVVHCGGRTRSYLGVESLRRMGLPNPIVAVKNGTMGWQLDGLELERGATRWPPAASEQSRARAREVAARVAAEDGTPLVSPDAVADRWSRRTQENVTLLDVRTREEYEAGHVPGSQWAPGGQAVQATDEYVTVRGGWLVLICDGFGRSVMTAGWLKRMGFPHVAVMEGGVPAWQRSGRAVETGQPPVQPAGYEAAHRVVERVPAGPLGEGLVLSVDPSDAYLRGHVPGAQWVGRGRLEATIERAAPDRSQPVIVTCADGVQSTLAAATLRRMGYANARVLDGGLAAWRAAGLEVESGPGTMLDEADDVVQKPYERGRAAMEAYLRWEEALDSRGVSPHALLPAAPPYPGAPPVGRPAQRAAPGLRVVDATFYLPHLKRDARAEFEQAHVPGAVFFDIDAVADHASPLPHMLPDAEAFADAVGALGIATGDRVIVYGGRGLIASARVWWTFRVFGHDAVAVLDGGLAKWRTEGRPVESGRPTPAPQRFEAFPRKDLVADLSRVLGVLERRDAQIVDARSRGRFAATEPEIRPGLRGGHIPGSMNLPYNELFRAADDAMLPVEEVQGAFARAGLDPARPVVATCGSGVSAAVLALALHRLGRRGAAVYDGSWTEWGGRADTPVAP